MIKKRKREYMDERIQPAQMEVISPLEHYRLWEQNVHNNSTIARSCRQMLQKRIREIRDESGRGR